MQGRWSGIVLPLLIAAVGIVLLLNTLQILPWSFWPKIVRFWPIVLIVFGLTLFARNVPRR